MKKFWKIFNDKFLTLPKNVPEFVYRLVRGSLYSFTFILWILSIALILFSFWYIYEGENYHLDNSIKFSVFVVSFLTGVVLFSLAICGLAGVLKENLLLAKIFLFGMVFLMLIELTSIFLIYAYKRQILQHSSTLFQKFIKQYADDDDIRILVDTIQADLKCCGISSPNDWDKNPYYNCNSISTMACSVPPSCCYNFTTQDSRINMFCGVGVRRKDLRNRQYQSIHVTGCKYSIYSFLDYKHKLTSSIMTAILVPQLIGLILIISYIITLNYLMQLDAIDEEFALKYRRQNALNPEISIISSSLSSPQPPPLSSISEVEMTSVTPVVTPSAPPGPDVVDHITGSKNQNLYKLVIGSKNDFLKKSTQKKYYINQMYSHDETHEKNNNKIPNLF